MIKLFRNVWLVHGTTDSELVRCLIERDHIAFWNILLYKQHVELEATNESFVKIFVTFFSNTLLQGKNSNEILKLLELYNLEYKLKTGKSLPILAIDDIISEFDLGNILLDIPKSDYGFEIMLPNYLLKKEPKDGLIKYVKWSCWNLLTQELYMFVQDIKRDIFSGHQVTGKNLNLANMNFDSLYGAIEQSQNWKFVLDSKLITDFDIDYTEQSISYFKKYFPTADDLIMIFNNHAKAHRDEQGIDSFREPIEMIYQDRYEELLFRDMLNDFRITYASDNLGKKLVCTFLSKVYKTFKSDIDEKESVYKLFELRTTKL